MYRPPFPEWMRPEPERVSDSDRYALWSTAERTSNSAKKRVCCYVGLRLFARYLGHATAWVGLATFFLRPENPVPTVEEEAEKLSGDFREGVEETLRASVHRRR